MDDIFIALALVFSLYFNTFMIIAFVSLVKQNLSRKSCIITCLLATFLTTAFYCFVKGFLLDIYDIKILGSFWGVILFGVALYFMDSKLNKKEKVGMAEWVFIFISFVLMTGSTLFIFKNILIV